MTNVININIQMEDLYRDYPQGTTSIPNASFFKGSGSPKPLSDYINYETASWNSGEPTPVISSNSISLPVSIQFEWSLVDVSTPVCNPPWKMTLATPMDQTAFFSETEVSSNNNYSVTMVSNALADSNCTFSMMCQKVNQGQKQRYIYSWDPTIRVLER